MRFFTHCTHIVHNDSFVLHPTVLINTPLPLCLPSENLKAKLEDLLSSSMNGNKESHKHRSNIFHFQFAFDMYICIPR